MSVMIILIIVSLFVASGFLAAFIWAVKSGQFDDASTPSYRMLWDDATTQKKINKQSSNHKQKSNGN
ncbi:cbb3-type cytochrome oxidase assembly protein CcoS [Marivirga arenosa]|uniref:Cbb3-type cytochrome oxidase assembly protein CcoS n=1 Tax=Marivirga arenosa TaxID=3059076 RepID=A0AA49GD28_9BACT|nr:cbb3-type cytochrome oxidase assembly protein CcoS [Marivirga sp. BKB1-2]WKK79248.1 cbb3-type cytochrome oxidase assembly protein CcoS [Marivirga sp. BKB1-2]